MQKIKEHVIYYYYSYLLALLSIVYGRQLTAHPDILQTYRVYQRVRNVFDHRFIGLFFIALGLVYGFATITNRKKIKQLSLPVFSFIWTFFSFSFILTEPPNTVWAFTLGMALLSFGISIRGDFKNG